jgi:photosystem II stability/assembly factor-like uncharacterized protein
VASRWVGYAAMLAVAAPALAGLGAWTPIGPQGSGFNTLAVDPTDPQTLIAATAGKFLGNPGPEGVVVSHDGGVSWRAAASGIAGRPVVAIAFDPAHPGRVFALPLFGGILRSDDGGDNWAQLNGPAPSRELPETARLTEPRCQPAVR